jgi:hypothetical protein
MFEFKGLNLKRGQNNLSLKKGGNIFYEVLNYSDEQSGKIYVIIDKSDLESLKSLAKENSTSVSFAPPIQPADFPIMAKMIITPTAPSR